MRGLDAALNQPNVNVDVRDRMAVSGMAGVYHRTEVFDPRGERESGAVGSLKGQWCHEVISSRLCGGGTPHRCTVAVHRVDQYYQSGRGLPS